MKKIAIVSGGTGFIGRRFLDLLHNKGFKSFVLVRKSSNTKFLPSSVETIVFNPENLEQISPHIRQAHYFFHFAALTKGNKRDFLKVNVGLTEILAKAVIKNKSKDFERFVFLSSQAASKPSDMGIDEGVASSPVSNYGRSKLSSEKLLREMKDELPITIIRPPTVYGPGDKDVFTLFQMANKGFIPIVGDPNKKFSIIHVDDLCRGILFLAENSKTLGKTYFLGNKEPEQWGDFAKKMQKITKVVIDKKAKILNLPFGLLYPVALFNEFFALITRKPPLLGFEKIKEMSHSWVCSSDRAFELGFQNEILIEDGLRDTFRWYLENNWL